MKGKQNSSGGAVEINLERVLWDHLETILGLVLLVTSRRGFAKSDSIESGIISFVLAVVWRFCSPAGRAVLAYRLVNIHTRYILDTQTYTYICTHSTINDNISEITSDLHIDFRSQLYKFNSKTLIYILNAKFSCFYLCKNNVEFVLDIFDWFLFSFDFVLHCIKNECISSVFGSMIAFKELHSFDQFQFAQIRNNI